MEKLISAAKLKKCDLIFSTQETGYARNVNGDIEHVRSNYAKGIDLKCNSGNKSGN